MKKDGSGYPDQKHAKAYQAVQKGMSQREAARIFNVCAKTIRRMIRSGPIEATESEPPKLTSDELADLRAQELSGAMSELFSGTRYPVVNPEAMIVKPHMTWRTNKSTGAKVKHEGTPRTWITDTLRVASIPDPRNTIKIFTGAQNDTQIHEGFWENLVAYADAIGADIVVGPWTYETNWWNESNPASRSYDSRIADHLCFGQMQIGDNFMFAGEMNTLPTANRPISDLTTYSKGRWAVYPHARLQLLSVPAANPTEQAFQIMTTGAITMPQVVPRKAGIKSLDLHTIGATIVEFNHEGDHFCRQLLAEESGAFQDLDIVVRNGRVSRGNPVEAVTAADIHIAKLDRDNALATFGFDYETGLEMPGSILQTLQPKWLFLHDIHDHESRNHHNRDDVGHNYEMAVRGRESVRAEVNRGVTFLKYLKARVSNTVVVESNHDLALERYITEGRHRLDGINYEFGLDLEKAYAVWRRKLGEAIDAKKDPGFFSMLEWAMRNIGGTALDHVRWVYDNDSLVINGTQMAYHGFRGANGAKGTVSGYARMGHKLTIGDKHSPSILDRTYGAGVMQLKHGYNKGPSGWCVSHVVQYPNGHRAMITLQKGKWRGGFICF